VAISIVSYVDIEGLRHSVEVEAEGLYEAAVLAIRIYFGNTLVSQEQQLAWRWK
jgi:hypothetical protein